MSQRIEKELERQLQTGEIPAGSAQAEAAQKLIDASRDYREKHGEIPWLPEEKPVSLAKPVALEIPKVDKETYQRLLEALKNVGYDFVAQIEAKSMWQRKKEDKEEVAENQRLGYVNPSETMRSIVPPEMKVAINSKRPKIENSNNLSTDAQKQMIVDEETKLKAQLPEDLRNLISMIMPDPSTQDQMDEQFQKQYGKPLYTNFFGRTDVEIVPGLVAYAGRYASVVRFYVGVYPSDHGLSDVFAVPAVVLPQVLDG